MLLNVAFGEGGSIFKTGNLHIDSVQTTEKLGAYENIIFKLTQQNEWILTQFNHGKAITEITNVEVVQTDSFPVQVFLKISGIFSNGCPEVGKVLSKLINNEFKLSVNYKYNSQPDVVCTDALVNFSKISPLAVYGLKKGTYNYRVNEVFSGSFTLKKDNTL
ncbi:MAG: hypothetical protein KAG26_02020 [Methylococcales bacterium]|nr:hypothetical protein [Methylococcales bacterium]